MAVANSIQNPASTQQTAIFTIAGSLPAGSVVQASISQNFQDTVGTPQVSVPPNQVWHYLDGYVAAALSPTDLTIDFFVNNTAQNLNMNTAVMVASGGNTSRINPFQAISGLTIAPNSTVIIKGATAVVNSGSSATELVYFTVAQAPLGNYGTPVTKPLA
jgi:hypothetical protein